MCWDGRLFDALWFSTRKSYTIRQEVLSLDLSFKTRLDGVCVRLRSDVSVMFTAVTMAPRTFRLTAVLVLLA